MPVEVIVYVTSAGRTPFREWLDGLGDRRGAFRVVARIERLATGNFGDCRSVGDGVQELRMFFGPGYRVYFGRRGETVVILLCGGDKGSQQRDIARAKELWRDWLHTEGGEESR